MNDIPPLEEPPASPRPVRTILDIITVTSITIIINIIIMSIIVIIVYGNTDVQSHRLPDGVGTNGIFTERPQVPYVLSYVATCCNMFPRSAEDRNQ